MKTWLFYPPFADPTQPYLSLPYLKGYLQEAGRDTTVVDLNVDAAHYLLGTSYLEECTDKIGSRLSRLNRQPQLSGMEQMEYLALSEARDAVLTAWTDDASPLDTLKDAHRFYEPGAYRQARDRAEAALLCASAVHFPYRFHFNQAAHIALPWGRQLLTDYIRNRKSPLDRFYRSVLGKYPLSPGDVVGVSLTFVSQIPESFYLMHLIRQLVPEVFIVAGGTCLQQMMGHAPEAVRRWVLQMADGLCLFEGEETLAGLLQALAGDGEATAGVDPMRRFARLCEVPNLLVKDPHSGCLQSGPMTVTDQGNLPPPDYSDLDLDRYLAPSRTLLFAPARGCYWNQCTFCEYGLNRSGHHAYRQMDPGAAAGQLMALGQRYAVKSVYLSVDALSPHFARELAEALVARGAALNWSSDFRIDTQYTPECCGLLQRSGLRAVAFGVESGSDRVLRLMKKGTRVETIRKITANFHRAGIATAWMTFNGYPGERTGEALDTIRLMKTEMSNIDLFILGRFGLTSGAKIAAEPQLHGIRRVFYSRGDDFRLYPLYECNDSYDQRAADRIENALREVSRSYYLDHYPWAGAVSTHHSLLYILRFGPAVFQKLASVRAQSRGSKRARPARWTNALKIPLVFDPGVLRRRRDHFFERFWPQALAAEAGGEAPLEENFFMAAVNGKEFLLRKKSRR